MSNAIDMTLDDLIKKNKQSKSKSSRGRGGARTSSSAPGGPTRRNFKRRGNRSAPFSTAKVQAPRGSWPVAASIETGTKLYISNLHYGVSTEDLKELFSIVGELKNCNIHYDRIGRSKETADVVFSRRVDALAAIKKYNNVQLDGKPMKIEIVGKNISSLATPPASVSVNKNSSSGGRSRGKGRGQARRSGRGGARRGGGRGRGDRGEKVSAEDLDSELDKYHTESMQTN